MDMPDIVAEDTNGGAQNALKIAFQTMQERCKLLQKRLTEVEAENMTRVERSVNGSDAAPGANENNEVTVADLQKKLEEVTKQKTQLTHHVFMVAAENRQLWSRLTKLTRSNKSLGNQLIKISDTLNKHPTTEPVDVLTQSFKELASEPTENNSNKPAVAQSVDSGNREPSLEEISLRLINSIMTEKSELEQQCTEMVEMQNGADINLEAVGFTYSEEESMDSLRLLDELDDRLRQTKDALLHQQARLKRALRCLTKMKKENACKDCRVNANKTTCQIGTQSESDSSLKENGATQTSLPPSTCPAHENRTPETVNTGRKVCPLCEACFDSTTTFEMFHEHVVGHFGRSTRKSSTETQ